MFIFTQQLVFMYKYKYFLISFGLIAILLLFSFFPVSFDNNDDQVMYFISSGLLSGTPSSHTVLTNTIIGSTLKTFFSFSTSVNWYTVYLETVLFLSFTAVSIIFVNNERVSSVEQAISLLIIFLGFFAMSFLYLQFTTVALFSCFTSLLLLFFERKRKYIYFIAILFIAIAILIRKETFYIFLLFSIPMLFKRKLSKLVIYETLKPVLIVTVIFFIAYSLNNNNVYERENTYNNITALDLIAASPFNADSSVLNVNSFTKEDILLMQSWFPADEAYLSGEKIYKLGKSLRKIRNSDELFAEINKFIKDERYLLSVYFLTTFLVVFFVRRNYKFILLNFFLFFSLSFYLLLTYRMPHRISFPILSYLIFLNIFFIAESNSKKVVKNSLLIVLLSISFYKFYCATINRTLYSNYHSIYESCRNEINKYPQYIFLAADGFPLQYMNAWQKPEDNFPAHNLILTGWYTSTPNYQQMLSKHRLKNLTSDLKNKTNVLFLTDSKQLMDAYVCVMKQRYNISCHFEEQTEGFKQLRPKKLIIEKVD